MKKTVLITSSGFILSILYLLSSCQPGVDLEAEKIAIQQTAKEHYEASNVGGVEGAEGYASFATPDAYWMPPQNPLITGREAIKDYALPTASLSGFHVEWDHPHVVVAQSGEIAYSVGTYKGSGEDTDGNLTEFKGKLVNIWHKQSDGSWKIAVAIWNTNEPPPVPEPEKTE